MSHSRVSRERRIADRVPLRRYSAGDVLEIRPCNSKEDVDRFLSSTRWTDIADEPYLVHPASIGMSLYIYTISLRP